MGRNGRRSTWVQSGIALILAAGLLAATVTETLAASKASRLGCADASWDCTLSVTEKVKRQ
jgi:hypothetical protein